MQFPVIISLHIYFCKFVMLDLNKPDEDWYWPVEISQLNSI